MGLAVDIAIIVAYFAIIASVGLYMGRRERSLHDFALGGRRVPWWAVMASIIAAETSAATFLGTPGEGFEKRSIVYVQLTIGVILGRIIVGFSFLKPYYAYKVYTVYDYLGVRFGSVTKGYASTLFLIFRTLASGTRLFIPSLVMVLAWRLLVGGQMVRFDQAAVAGVGPYAVAIIVLTVLTCIYTAAGGIKAVIWTDVIQACLMFCSALIAIGTLLYHIGGFHALIQAAPQMTHLSGYMITGFEADQVATFKASQHVAAMGLWDYVRLILANEYTLFAAFIGATMGNMAAFGTDQDMVQRLLTAETHVKSRRSLITAALMDIPIAAAFSFIGVLLYVYYMKDPTFLPRVTTTVNGVTTTSVSNSDVFGSYILNVMPVGIRGLVLAGVFATAMGSLSAALNALATSATNDWYVRRVRGRPEHHYVNAARWFTALFAVLMILVAIGFAYLKVTNPTVRIIPLVLGIGNYFLGPMLGVFLIGMFTRRRGSDIGNVIAISCGLVATFILGGLHVDVANWLAAAFGSHATFARPDWLPQVQFTWFAMIGAVVVFAIGSLFPTPSQVLDSAAHEAEQADEAGDRPIALRE